MSRFMKPGGGSRGSFLTIECTPDSNLLTKINAAITAEVNWYKENMGVRFTSNEYEVTDAAAAEMNGISYVAASRT